MREARPPIPPAREEGPRRPRGCEPRRDPSVRRGAAVAGASRATEAAVKSVERPALGPIRVQAPQGTASSALGRGARRPQPPTPGEGCVSFVPAGGQDVGAGQRLGGGGGVGDGEPVAAAGALASGELAKSATFSATFAKGKIKILQVVAQLQVASGPANRGEGALQPSRDGRRPPAPLSGTGGAPGGDPGRGRERMGCRGARCGR